MNQNEGINVLALFDGISTGQLAINELKIPINNYFASEIDKRAIKVTQHHYPNTIQLGDIKKIKGKGLPQIDLLLAGSPCVDLSSLRKNREGLNGEKSGLFFEALRLMNEVTPKYFVFENVGSMSGADKFRFDELLGVKGVYINSNLLSAQNRNRIYWSNIPLTIPTDRNIALKDIIEDGYVDRQKSCCVVTKNVSHTKKGLIRYLTKSIGGVVFLNKSFSELPKKEKLKVIEYMNVADVKSLYRLFTPYELEQLQTLDIGYVSNILRKTPTGRAVGNSFTKEIIIHILSGVDFFKPNE